MLMCCMPCFQEKSVMPSGLFESSWHKPVGSGAEVCLAAPMALSKMSFILSCLGLVPFYLHYLFTQILSTTPQLKTNQTHLNVIVDFHIYIYIFTDMQILMFLV